MNKNLIGTTEANGYPFLPLRERLAIYQKIGFRSVMLWWGEPDGVGDKETRKERVALAQEYGLQVENVHSDLENSNALWMPGLFGDEKMRAIIKAVEDCQSCGVERLVLHLTNGINAPDVSGIGLQRFERILACAIKCEVVLAIENVRTEKHVRYVLDHYSDRHVAFCYDSGHANVWCKDVDWLSLYGDRLAAVHLHDNRGQEDEHICPLAGAINWSKVMTQINDSAYTGSLTLETEYRGDADIEKLEVFLRESYDSGLRLGVL